VVERLSEFESPSSVDARVSELLAANRAIIAELARDTGPATVETVLRPIDRASRELGNLRRGLSLLRSVHPDARLSSAFEAGERAVSAFFTELYLDAGVFRRLSAVDPLLLDREARRYLDRLLRDFRRSGVDRDEATRREIQLLREQLVELGQAFANNIASDVRSIELDGAEELDGLPLDFVRTRPPGPDGKIRITTNLPDYSPFMMYARSKERREELYRQFRSRGQPNNEPVLRSILERRHRLASLLGHANWADYVAEEMMIGSGAAIASFIDRVAAGAEERSLLDYARFLERKRRDEPHAAEICDWERAYYEELIRHEEYRVDSREIRAYLPFERVKNGILDVLADLFGIEFHPDHKAARWHPDVEVLDIHEGGEIIGRLYLDLHPRERKFKHAAMFSTSSGVRGGPAPGAALVCNIPRPTAEDPGLLEHGQVLTLFHEFGHLLHHIFGKDVDWDEFSGTGTEWDFVEVPSQLLEEWGRDAAVLQRFARHHQTGAVLPAELIERLRESEDLGRGAHVRTQMFYAALSLQLHVRDPMGIEFASVERELQARYSRFRHVEGTHFTLAFGHLDNYSALYYTYMWSLVIEKDVVAAFRRHGLMDRETATRLRARILSRGGSYPASELVRDFLGRDYSFDAFDEWLEAGETTGVAAEAAS
jgi:thimet oligopeptidase